MDRRWWWPALVLVALLVAGCGRPAAPLTAQAAQPGAGRSPASGTVVADSAGSEALSANMEKLLSELEGALNAGDTLDGMEASLQSQ